YAVVAYLIPDAVQREACTASGTHTLRPFRLIQECQLPGSFLGEVWSATRRSTYSMNWSARASSEGGIVRPRALAVLRLMTSSNFVGCSTGRSAGLAPLRIFATCAAPRRRRSAGSGP